MLAVESLFLAGLGVGLASIAGVRAFVPLALFSLFARLGFIVEPDILGLQIGWTVVLVLWALAVVEIMLDKVRALDPAFGYVMIPIRMVAGAVLFAAVYEPGALFDAGAVPGFVAGGAIAGLVAGRRTLGRRAHDNLGPGDQAGDRSTGHEARYCASVKERPRLVHRRKQDRACHHSDGYHDVAERRIQSPDLVQRELHDRQSGERQDNGPSDLQAEDVRLSDIPEPHEQRK